MRLTGQATTALGNVIINMLVHWRFYQLNKTRLSFALFLGDDNFSAFNQRPDDKNLRKTIAAYYNMMSKNTCN